MWERFAQFVRRHKWAEETLRVVSSLFVFWFFAKMFMSSFGGPEKLGTLPAWGGFAIGVAWYRYSKKQPLI